jgi:hypothetical protein
MLQTLSFKSNEYYSNVRNAVSKNGQQIHGNGSYTIKTWLTREMELTGEGGAVHVKFLGKQS